MRQIMHKTLLVIYNDYNYSLTVKGVKNVICLFIKQITKARKYKISYKD